MSEKTFTHKALAELLGVSETTVKSYRRKFPGCIPVFNQGKPIRFTVEAAAVATRIRDLFETGMSVEEVRARLSQEFAWISHEQPKTKGKSSSEVSPELSTGVSNMAKSMVAMAQQQNNLLARMQGIEHLLEDMGLKSSEAVDRQRRKNADAARERELFLEDRLNRLDAATRELADNLSALSGQLGRFLGQRSVAARDWTKGDAADTLAAAALLVGENAAEASAPGQDNARDSLQTRSSLTPNPESPSPKVISLHAANQPGKPAFASDAAMQRPGSAHSGGANALSQEPPRLFFSLPLMARTGQGQYVSAGGRGRGRFSLNDLKAMLIYGFSPPNHFTLRWEIHGQGWWLHLEQHSHQLVYSLLLMELPSQKGGNVVEILQIKKNDDLLHPAEICSIIDSFGA